jgi:hypothetical protein
MHPGKNLRFPSHLRQWTLLGLLTLLTFIMLYPLSLNLTRMVPEPADPLLNAWRMHWNVRAFLSGPAAIADVFNTNIFYPFPLTLAYSEHFLMLAAQALPFLLISDSHIFGLNVSVLLTFILSGYAMYLLVSAWTGNRWAGWVAGILFAFSPHRFGQLNHLELLVTQWLPLALLALHWTLTRPGLRYPLLFGLFFNLQTLSGFHFSLNLTLACALLVLVYALSRRVYWRWGLAIAAMLLILVTFLLNWPIWQTYLRFSDVMGAVRTPGEVRIYSAALTDYFTAIPYHWLYGWTFGRWQSVDHQFQPLMPFGLTGLLLALLGLGLTPKPRTQATTNKLTSPAIPIPYPPSHIPHPISPILIFLFLLTLLSLLLSFGLNENALGPDLASVLQFSPYVWLYNHVTFFQAIRVPGRFGILVVIGLVGLAGWGATSLSRLLSPATRFVQPALVLALTAMILLESWSAPLAGPGIPAGSQLAPIYHWLQATTPPETVVLELPFQGASEFMYEYASSYHWRRLANGGTGFTPPIYREMRQWFKTFPTARSVDVIQQMGIDRVILHSAAYKPEEWQRLMADLPLYLPAFSQVNQIGEALVLQVSQPGCPAQPDQIKTMLTPTAGLDGLLRAVQITYHNEGVAAFTADVRKVSHLTFGEGAVKNFTEPLVTPAGEAQSVLVPLPNEQTADHLTGAWLATLNRTAPATGQTTEVSPSTVKVEANQWQPLNLKFARGPELLAYQLMPATPTPCSKLTLALKWAGGQAGDTALVQLLDPFGRLVVEQVAQPWLNNRSEVIETRTIPLVGSLPAGRYGLRIYVRSADGQERLPVTAAGVTLPSDQLPPLPLVIQPGPAPAGWQTQVTPPRLDGKIRMVGRQLDQTDVAAGDWLRFTLVWQAEYPLETDLTVFTQLLGPDGHVWGQWDNQPKGGWYSTSLWQPGQPVTDDYAFQIEAQTPPGTYRLIAGMYDSATLERLPVQPASGAGQDFVDIGSVRVGQGVGQP